MKSWSRNIKVWDEEVRDWDKEVMEENNDKETSDTLPEDNESWDDDECPGCDVCQPSTWQRINFWANELVVVHQGLLVGLTLMAIAAVIVLTLVHW